MLEQIKSKLADEQVQRTILGAGGMVATFIATQLFARLMNKSIEAGIDALMNKIHNNETPAE